jgi:hypothetical protein
MKNKGYRISLCLWIVLACTFLVMSFRPRFVAGEQVDGPLALAGKYEDAVVYGWPFVFWRRYVGVRELNTFKGQVDIRAVALDAIFWMMWAVLACMPALVQFVLNCRARVISERMNAGVGQGRHE